ncbi:hypothetical protein [Glycomyces dulcitolivorans]|uniref:hypothetical protein n=1 Tax=Glycomyces dulcitolivorans TaxID=2200759 RepID=UPI000DD2CF37|nr:hypothetical protein [Glycomyces dulcitolivorans]
MLALVLILSLIGVVCLLVWAHYRFGIFNGFTEDPLYRQQFGSASATQELEAKVALPSKDLYYQFDCNFKVHYTSTRSGTEGREPPLLEVESLLFSTGKDQSVKLALPQKDQLRHELNGVFMNEQPMPGHDFRITAECIGIDVDPKQLAAVKHGFAEDLADERLRKKVAYLESVFESPRNATMWWLAQNVDKVEDLPNMAELLYRLDRRLHPDANPSKLPLILDLDWFIEGATDDKRAAIGVALAGIYKKYGEDVLAKEAESLIPNRTMPSRIRDEEDPDDPDAGIPAQATRS